MKDEFGTKIPTQFQWVNWVFEEVFNGEDTATDCFYKQSCQYLIKEQRGNWCDHYGQKDSWKPSMSETLLKRWKKLKLKYEEVQE